MKPQYTTFVLLEIHHTKPIPDLTDLAADRIYRMDGVEDVTARIIPEEDVPRKDES